MKVKVEVLLTRHWQTEWNLEGKVQGRADIELNEKGLEQAIQTSNILAKEEIDLIYQLFMIIVLLKEILENLKG